MYVELHARSAFSFLEGASFLSTALRCAEVQMPASVSWTAMAFMGQHECTSRPRMRESRRTSVRKLP